MNIKMFHIKEEVRGDIISIFSKITEDLNSLLVPENHSSKLTKSQYIS